MTIMLDKSKDFGYVLGGGRACFEQNGIHFGQDGVEIPGFESVTIPEGSQVVIVADPAAQKEIDRLTEENKRLVDENSRLLAEKLDAEELTKELDAASVEIPRLTEQLAALTPSNEPAAEVKDPVGKGGKSAVDKQLELQGKA